MKWRFVYFSEDYSLEGTNDEILANKIAEGFQVYDCETGCEIGQSDPIPEIDPNVWDEGEEEE